MHFKHLITAVLFAVVAVPAFAAGTKTTICHIPPGNPDNMHAITISDSAVAAHVEQHGDYALAAGGTCGTHATVVPNSEISAAVEVCSNSGTATGRRVDVTGLGGVQTSAKNCGS